MRRVITMSAQLTVFASGAMRLQRIGFAKIALRKFPTTKSKLIPQMALATNPMNKNTQTETLPGDNETTIRCHRQSQQAIAEANPSVFASVTGERAAARNESNQNRLAIVRYMDTKNIGALFSDTRQEWLYARQITNEIADELMSEKVELRNFANLIGFLVKA